MTIDTGLVLKALAEENSGTDGTGTALDMKGDWGLVMLLINITALKGDPASRLDLVIEGSADNSKWYTLLTVPTLSAPGEYRVPLLSAFAANKGYGGAPGAYTGLTYSDDALALREAPRYLRKNSTVTAGGGGSGDGVTFSIHVTA